MPHYGLDSRQKLDTTGAQLQAVFLKAIEHRDIKIIEGARPDALQALYFDQGRSKLDGVTKKSKHQTSEKTPKSRAIDAGPYYADEWPRLPWSTSPLIAILGQVSEDQAWKNLENLKRWHGFGGYILGIGDSLGITLRWGGDWDGDERSDDQGFHDLPHFELVE